MLKPFAPAAPVLPTVPTASIFPARPVKPATTAASAESVDCAGSVEPPKPTVPGVPTAPATAQWALAAGESLFQAGERGGLWRVVSGLVRLDQVGPRDTVLVMLAQAGDLLGFESLCGEGYQLNASAFNDVVLLPLQPASDAQRQQWLIEAVLQQPQRSHDMARVRTGQVVARLSELLRLLGHAPLPGFVRSPQPDADAVRNSLPPLRVLAEVVDAKTETVCRALAQLLPPRTKKSGPKPASGWKQAGAAASAAMGSVAAQALGLRLNRAAP